MDKDILRIAVASSDGIVVNNHFGRAKTFYIYEKSSDDTERLIEKRDVIPICECANHDDIKLNDNLEKLSDCDYLLVSRIGYEAANAARQKGIEPYEIPGIISKSIERLVQYIKIQNLFE